MFARSKRLQPASPAPWAGIRLPAHVAAYGPPPVSPGQGRLAMPFDALRFQYACAVKAGLVERSLLASSQLERALDTLEKLILGPLARQR